LPSSNTMAAVTIVIIANISPLVSNLFMSVYWKITH
jgi:hypothetical protein